MHVQFVYHILLALIQLDNIKFPLYKNAILLIINSKELKFIIIVYYYYYINLYKLIQFNIDTFMNVHFLIFIILLCILYNVTIIKTNSFTSNKYLL